VRLSCEAQGERVRLMVSDTGIGIASELQPLVFDPFQRLGQENGAIQGTGIGLSLCKEYAALMNGEMGLRSQPNAGSQFWIDLPRYTEPERPASAIQAQHSACVYHADLDSVNRAVVGQALAGVELLQFDDGNQVLAAVLKNGPTCCCSASNCTVSAAAICSAPCVRIEHWQTCRWYCSVARINSRNW